MIKTVQMYTVICDNCGKDVCDGAEYSAWNYKGYVEDIANEEGWQKIDDCHYCPDCIEYDEDDELIIKTNDRKKTKTERP